MYAEIANQKQFNKMEISAKKKVSYSLKKLLKQLFKQHKSQKMCFQPCDLTNAKKAESLESLESLENMHNSNIEFECASPESQENDINERISFQQSCETEEAYDISDINATNLPVHFIRTAEGIFFWTASSDIPADNDLVQPMSCSTYNQLACMQDRWAQA